MPSFRASWPLWAALLLFFLVAGWYSVTIPVGEGVDEVSHLAYIQFVQEQRRLPVQPLDHERPLEVWMGHHPPFYYLITALACTWCDFSGSAQLLPPNPHFAWSENDPSNGWTVHLHDAERERFPYRGTLLAIHYLRLLSVAMSLVTLVAVHRIGRLLLPERPWVAVSAVLLVGLIPSFLFMSSTIHHDVLVAMLFTLALWWMVSALIRPTDARRAIVGGLLVALALLTKLSALSLLPLAVLTFLLMGRRTGEWWRTLRGASLFFGTVLLVAGWWFVRNLLLYGDPLGMNALFSVFTHMARQEPFGWMLFRSEFVAQLSRTFWAAFGYMHITLAWEIQRWLWLAAAALLLLALLSFVSQRRALLADGRWRGWLLLLVAMLVVFVAFVRLAVSMRGAGQGRYLFTLAAPIGLFLAVGLHTLLGWRFPRLATVLGGSAMLFFALTTMHSVVRPLYAAPLPVEAAAFERRSPTSVRFGDALHLVGYQWEPPRAYGGAAPGLTLYWQAMGAARPDLFITLSLHDREGTLLWKEARWPEPNGSTATWRPGAIHATHHQLAIPEQSAAGVARLEVAVQVGREGEQLPSTDGAGEPLAQAAIPLLVRPLPSSDSSPGPAYPLDALLGEQIRLLGYDLPRARVQPGGPVELTLYWQPIAPVAKDYIVFVQLLSETGALIAQQDSEPEAGAYPTSFWVPGETVSDRYRLLLPADASPGDYRLIVGMYEWPSVQRLPVMQGGVAGDAVILAILAVHE